MQWERPANEMKLAQMIEPEYGNGVDLLIESKCRIQNSGVARKNWGMEFRGFIDFGRILIQERNLSNQLIH